MLSQRQKFIKKITLPLVLLVFFSLFITDFLYVPLADSSTIKFFTPRESTISHDLSPRIDEEAAAVVKENDQILPLCFTSLGAQKALTGQAFPSELWIFLLTAYLFLMLFNLFINFEHSHKVQWFWESGYTILALWTWYAFDGCRTNLWFPLYVLKLGTIVYLVYLHLFIRRKKSNRFPTKTWKISKDK